MPRFPLLTPSTTPFFSSSQIPIVVHSQIDYPQHQQIYDTNQSIPHPQIPIPHIHPAPLTYTYLFIFPSLITPTPQQRKIESEMQIEAAEDGEDHHQKDSPSFRMESPEKIATAVDHHNNDEIQDDFDFSFIPIPESGPPIAADDIFSDGKIRPVYPVFNRDLLNDDDVAKEKELDQSRSAARLSLRRLFIEEEREFSSTSSSESLSSSLDELDGIPPGTYCVWTPNVKKSSSTGSSLRWRLRDLVVGRSQSDKFVFMPIRKEQVDGSKKEIEKGKKKKLGKTEVDVVTAQQRMRYYDHGQGRKYKADLVGFFANVNGLSRSRHHHPL